MLNWRSHHWLTEESDSWLIDWRPSTFETTRTWHLPSPIRNLIGIYKERVWLYFFSDQPIVFNLWIYWLVSFLSYEMWINSLCDLRCRACYNKYLLGSWILCSSLRQDCLQNALMTGYTIWKLYTIIYNCIAKFTLIFAFFSFQLFELPWNAMKQQLIFIDDTLVTISNVEAT